MYKKFFIFMFLTLPLILFINNHWWNSCSMQKWVCGFIFECVKTQKLKNLMAKKTLQKVVGSDIPVSFTKPIRTNWLLMYSSTIIMWGGCISKILSVGKKLISTGRVKCAWSLKWSLWRGGIFCRALGICDRVCSGDWYILCVWEFLWKEVG